MKAKFEFASGKLMDLRKSVRAFVAAEQAFGRPGDLTVERRSTVPGVSFLMVDKKPVR